MYIYAFMCIYIYAYICYGRSSQWWVSRPVTYCDHCEAPADGQMFGAWMQCQTPEGTLIECWFLGDSTILYYIYVILNTTTNNNNNSNNNSNNNNNGNGNNNDNDNNNNNNNRSNSSHNSNDSSNSNNNNLGISWTLFSGERREQIGARRLAIFPINKYGEPGGATNWDSQPHDGFSSILTIGYVRSVSLGNWRLFDDSVLDFATQCIVDYDHLWAGIPFLTNHFCWSWQSQWIGSREKIQDTYIHISIYVIRKSTVSCNFSLKPIHWQRLLNPASRGLGNLMQKVTTSPVHIKYHPCGPHLMNISHASSTHFTLGEVMVYMYTYMYICMYI